MFKKFKFNMQTLKKNLPLVLISVVIVVLCRQALFNHYKAIAKGDKSDFVYKLESGLLDWRFNMRGPEKPKTKVGILAIDEKSIQQFGRWPFSRRFYNRALENLKKMGVSWIGFDAIFSEPEVPTLADAKSYLDVLKKSNGSQIGYNLSKAMDGIQKMEAISPGDASFARGVKNFENIVLGFFYMKSQFEVERSGIADEPFKNIESMDASAIEAIIFPGDESDFSNYEKSDLNVSGALANIPALSASTDHFAFFSNEPDGDAIVRWTSLLAIIDGRLMPSLSLKVAAEAMDRDIVVFFNEIGVEAISLVSREDDTDSVEVPVDFYGRSRFLMNHRGPGYETFPHISLADAFNGTFSDKAKEFLPGSILLLGATATGTNDQRPNPFDPALDGVENHATVIDNIMAKDFIKRVPEMQKLEMNLVVGLGLVFAPIMIFSNAVLGGIFAIIFCFGYYYFDQIQWFSQGVWAYMAMPYIEIISLFILITIYKYATEEREKRKVKGAFSHYLSSDVMEQVLDDPDSLSLGGERKNLTVFFSDVRGFTTISESLTPEKLCTLMNDYFTPMTGIILKSRGVLDKYIGDAIMAFWGAPIEIEDHADVAADACIEMLYALEVIQKEFDEKGYPWVDIGIGLNTGAMSVGNMGSDERFQYTVMGDSVNLGSRLEGMTKNYGVRCMISEYTVANFKRPETHIIRDLDDIQVKGKVEPVKVFELIRPDYLKDSAKLEKLLKHFEAGRIHYRAQDWENAEKEFGECMLIHPDDGPTNTYLKRISEMKKRPKIENWDGVTRFTTK